MGNLSIEKLRSLLNKMPSTFKHHEFVDTIDELDGQMCNNAIRNMIRFGLIEIKDKNWNQSLNEYHKK